MLYPPTLCQVEWNFPAFPKHKASDFKELINEKGSLKFQDFSSFFCVKFHRRFLFQGDVEISGDLWKPFFVALSFNGATNNQDEFRIRLRFCLKSDERELLPLTSQMKTDGFCDLMKL